MPSTNLLKSIHPEPSTSNITWKTRSTNRDDAPVKPRPLWNWLRDREGRQDRSQAGRPAAACESEPPGTLHRRPFAICCQPPRGACTHGDGEVEPWVAIPSSWVRASGGRPKAHVKFTTSPKPLGAAAPSSRRETK